MKKKQKINKWTDKYLVWNPILKMYIYETGYVLDKWVDIELRPVTIRFK